jgi:hypothetical protein
LNCCGGSIVSAYYSKTVVENENEDGKKKVEIEGGEKHERNAQ